MKKLLILWMVLVAFASCTDRKDLFDSGRVKEEAKENFPIKDIDPDQDWNMMAVRTLDITINAGTGALIRGIALRHFVHDVACVALADAAQIDLCAVQQLHLIVAE